MVLDQLSKGLLLNYGRNIAHLALHFNRVPHEVSVSEINAYLYRKPVHEDLSLTYFKHMIYGMRFWFRLCEKDGDALSLPSIKHKKNLPEVLSQAECKELFKAPLSVGFYLFGRVKTGRGSFYEDSDVDTLSDGRT